MRKQFRFLVSAAFLLTLFLAGIVPAHAVPADAGVIPLNGSSSGVLDEAGPVAWWQVTIPSDGKLVVNTDASITGNQLTIMLYLYDRDGTHEIKSYNSDWGVHTSVNMDNLLPGTYWVKAERWTGGGSYAISSTFTPTALPVEAESNDTLEGTGTIPLNGSTTGHLGFYRDEYTDTVDWWKVTIPKDGKLLVETTANAADPGLQIMLYLYDQNGTTKIKDYNGDWGNHTTLNFDNLLPGTYWIKAQHWTGHGSYTIQSTFTPSPLDVESESNDSTRVALDLAPNGSATAHLGFYRDGYTDTTDWWKITVPGDGKLLVATEAAQPDSILQIMLYLYDRDGTRKIRDYNGDWGNHTTLNYDNLKAGTYYLRASHWSGHGSYRITSSFSPVHYANDSEPDNTRETACGIPVQATATGHLGYWGSDDLDSADYFSLTVPAGWDSLHVKLKADPTLTCIVHLLNSDGNQIAEVMGPDLAIVNPAAGKYFVHLSHWTGYGAYAFRVSNSWMAEVPVDDTEPLYPPSGLLVSDVPGDQGHRVQLNWTLSPSESGGAVLKYRIFRSRTAQFADPAPQSGFGSTEELNLWELTRTVLVDSVSAGNSQFIDTVPLNNTPYYYWVQAVGADGVSKMASSAPIVTAVAESAPKEFRVAAPYPNPFNPSVTIGYTLPETLHVHLTIYDSLGRVVTVLEDGMRGAGPHEAVWNGRSGSGETLGSGIYLYRVEAGSHRVQGKMTLLR